jgi:ATP-binding cassette, subfamily C (CFTR/MRP), member 1
MNELIQTKGILKKNGSLAFTP